MPSPNVSVDHLLEGLPVDLAEVGAGILDERLAEAGVKVPPAAPEPSPGAPHPATSTPRVSWAAAPAAAGPGAGPAAVTDVDGEIEKAVLTGLEGEESDAYARVRDLPLPEKHKLARHGHRTMRRLLIRDLNKSVHVSVISNPQIQLEEVVEYSAHPGLSREAIDMIAHNRTWTASRQVLMNLVRNPATPVEVAARLVPRLGVNDWRVLARPGTVRPTISALARKLLAEESG
ncbi:MAG: hypothetical protein FJ087_23810 [Deltaproteobacteria bacterium]|nr:hypothetical protein [Deltaproteobacteria bacterium]